MAKAPVLLDLPTLRFYAQSAQVYCASGPGGVSRNLDRFLRMLPRGARILELGCGGGRDAEAMIAAGFRVDPTDGTPEIARKAEERLRQPVRVMRFDELDAVETYDAVWANASLLHVPRSTFAYSDVARQSGQAADTDNIGLAGKIDLDVVQ